MLIETKLQIPQPKVNSILRTGLMDGLQRNLDRKLVAVVAGAGAGKTTLLAQAINRYRLPASYLSLESSDSELAVFMEYLTAGLARLLAAEGRSSLDRELAGELEALRQCDQSRPDPDALAARLVNALNRHRAHELFLVLDDYHVIPPESQVQRFLDLFIDRMPPVVHLIIASRSALTLPGMPRWASKREMTELTAGDLALGPEDARRLIASCYGADLAPEEFQQLMANTEGWVTGVHLIMQAAGMHKSVKETLNGYIAASRPMFDFFASEIFGREPAEVRKFLLSVSVLEELEPRACDFLTGRRDAAELLADLERRNIFIARSAPGSYRMHPLFKAFLQEGEGDRRSLEARHRQAAGFYAVVGNHQAAIEHAISGGDFQLAGRLLSEKHAEFTEASHFSRLGRWLKALPEDVYERFPLLLLPRARWLKEAGDRVGELEALERAAALLEKRRDRSGYCRALGNLAYRRSLDDRAGAVKLVQRALKLCPLSDSETRGGLYNALATLQMQQGAYAAADHNYARAISIMGDGSPNQIWLRNNQAVLQFYRGENLRALRMYRELISRHFRGRYALEVILIFYNAFRAAVESGHFDQAAEYLEQGRRLCQPYWDVMSRLLMDEAQGYLHLYQGNLPQAVEALSGIRDRYRQFQVEDRAAMTEVMLVRLHRLAGDLRAAEALLESIAARGSLFDGPPEAISSIMPWFQKGLLDAAAGRPKAALRAAEYIRRGSRRLSYQAGLFMSHLLAAKAAEGPASRRRHFKLAMDCSRRHGYDGILATELRADPVLSTLLDSAPASDRSVKGLRRLLGRRSAAEPGAEDRSFRVRLLGQMEVAGPGGEPMEFRWRTRKVQSLFAYLLLHRNRFCHREELIEALWPGLPLDRAKKALYHTAFTLKRNLAQGLGSSGLHRASRPPLQRQSQSYRLDEEMNFIIDVEELESIRNSAGDAAETQEQVDRLRNGLSLYRDAFLPSLSDLWCEHQRERYHGMFLFLSEKLGAVLVKSGRPEEALPLYRRLLNDEPLADRVRIQYWSALKQTGKTDAIHVDFREYARLLRRKFKEAPSEELKTAYDSLA